MSSIPISSPYLTAAEAAAYIRSTIQAIYALVKRRKLHPMPGRPGRLLFTREALDRYLQGRFGRLLFREDGHRPRLELAQHVAGDLLLV